MCGIGGFSFSDSTVLNPTGVARVLLAGLAERGQDATGWAWRRSEGPIEVRKASRALTHLLHDVELDADARQAIVHVREYTKGVPGIEDNNHPIRWGRVVGVHNGHLENDDELFERYHQPRSTPRITVDSEAIMMLSDVLGDLGEALGQVRGSAAVAVLRDDTPGRLFLARRTRRPLVLGHGDGVLLFASTREALENISRGAGIRLEFEALEDGTLVEVVDGREVARRRFAVDYRFPGRKLVEYPALPGKERLVRLALQSLAA
jgi:glucosamine 6-phosphate synthetase-like amidotransferase/phosphosugar isomerase protein